MTPEGKVKEKVKRILRKVGAWCTMPRGGAYGRAGVPDFLCCYQGIFVAIETKAGDNKLTPLQQTQFASIQKAKGIPLVVTEHNVHELEGFFHQLTRRLADLSGKESDRNQSTDPAGSASSHP